MMKKLNKRAYELIGNVVVEVFGGSGIKGADLFDDGDNPFAFVIEISVENNEQLVVRKCNELFHALNLLPEGKDLAMGGLSDYCDIVRGETSDAELFVATFNHPAVIEFDEHDPEMQFVLKNWREGINPAAKALVDGIKAGRLKSKKPDGYLVLKAEFYDAIESGEKTIEYRDFTEYNLKRTIGLKSVRFNRGYVKNAPQMKWEVKKIVLLDDDDNECDPFNVPEDFWPTTIAIHLGKRIG